MLKQEFATPVTEKFTRRRRLAPIMIRSIAFVLSIKPIQGFGVTSVDDTTTTTPPATTTTTPTTTTTTTTPNGDDGSVVGVDLCFMEGGNCASCCGACDKTTDIDNKATTDSCVCYEATTKPSGYFYGTNNNDCVFIIAEGVSSINVRNQCLDCLLYTSPSPRDQRGSRMPSSA